MRFEKVGGHTVLASALGSGSTVIDLGANRGAFAAALRDRFGMTARLVEANPLLAAELRARGDFPVAECAISSKTGQIPFNLARNDEASSILKLPTESGCDALLDRTVLVNTVTIEALLDDWKIEHVDLLKMDIEGAEVEVLSDIPSATLNRIAQISVEFHADESFGFDLSQKTTRVIHRLRLHGFVYLPLSPTLVNVLFLNRALLGISRVRGRLWEIREAPPGWLKKTWQIVPGWMKPGTRRLIEG